MSSLVLPGTGPRRRGDCHFFGQKVKKLTQPKTVQTRQGTPGNNFLGRFCSFRPAPGLSHCCITFPLHLGTLTSACPTVSLLALEFPVLYAYVPVLEAKKMTRKVVEQEPTGERTYSIPM